MKKIYSFLFLGLSLAALSSCSDDVTNDITVHGTELLSAGSTSFSAVGGTDTIVAKSPVTAAYSADSWLTTSVSGNSVAFTAAPNTSKESRHTTLVIKSSAQDSAIVDIDQLGAVLQLSVPSSLVFSDAAATRSYDYISSLPVTAVSTADWLSVSAGSKLTISAAANNTGSVRTANLSIISGADTTRVIVSQGSFSDLEGVYKLYTYENPQKPDSTYAQITKDKAGNPVLNLLEFGLVVPVTFSQNTLSISLSAGQYIGNYSIQGTTYAVYTGLFNYNSGKLTFSTSASYTSLFTAVSNTTVGQFTDNGSAPFYVNGIALGAYSVADSTKKPQYVGNLVKLFDPRLIRLDSAADSGQAKRSAVSGVKAKPAKQLTLKRRFAVSRK